MSGVRHWVTRAPCCLALTIAQVLGSWSAESLAQFPAPPGGYTPPPVNYGAGAPPAGQPPVPSAAATPAIVPGAGELVAEVRVQGNQAKSATKVLNEIGTRIGRPFDREQLQRDVRKLASKTWFLDVKPTFSRREDGGLVITFMVIERPVLEYVQYVGNTQVKEKKLTKETELKAGMPRDPYAVEEGRRRIEQYYQDNGYNGVQVTILEGDKPKDRGAIYLINEGQSQKVWSVNFEGNTIATDSRLKTQIQTKPPLFYLFKGQVDRRKIDEDVERLTSYYRSLGFFRARIGRELEWNEDQSWLTLRFVIDEGPRYQVRNIAIVGNTKFTSEQLAETLELKGSEFFDQPKLDADLGTIRDIYGSVGYVFADVQAETRFLEEPGQVDLVYNVAEGKRYRVGKINVRVAGEHHHTRQQVVLNRISLRPGDIVDIRKLRDSERRLKASGLFLNDPAQGVTPKLVIQPPELGDEELAEGPGGRDRVRGQSPDPVVPREGEEIIDIGVDGQPVRSAEWQRPLPPPNYWQNEAELRQREAYPGLPAPGSNNTQNGLMREPSPSYWSRPAQPTVPGRPSNATHPYRQPPQPQPVLVRGQSPSYWSPASQSEVSAGRNHTSQNYRQPPQPQPEVVRGQFAPFGGGRNLGGSPPPPVTPPAPTYTQPATTAPAYNQPAYSAPAATAPAYTAPAPNYAPQPTVDGRFVPPSVTQPAAPVTQGLPAPGFGNQVDPAFGQPGVPPVEGPYSPPFFEEPDGFVDIDSEVQETQTGRFMFGVGVNSDAGLVGSIVVDEQNFDWRRWPRNGWEDFRNGTAFRGGGQRFRLEAAPGTQVQRYLINFSEPYLFDTPIGMGLSGFYYTRGFTDWTEERLGGRVNLSYQFSPDLSGNIGFGGQAVDVFNERQPSPPALAEVVGNSSIYTFTAGLAHDTRDNTFLSTEGHRLALTLEQTIGDFVFPRINLEARKFFTLRERPDGSGRHVLSLVGQTGWSGDDTPLYDRFFIGGFSTLRGFRFRGAGPYDMGVNVGGDFMLLGSVEYMFPITADDMVRGVAFVDTGTVNENVSLDDYRVAPGLGLRITVPALGPAPIALDFSVPVASGPDDQEQVFSFFVGFGR